MEPIIGIDLGTTYSEAAYIFNGQAKVIEGHDNGIFHSCVGVDSNGGILVGMEAKNQYAAAPDRTVVSIKRWMGSDKKLHLGEDDYLPQEISAFILKALKRRAEKALGMEISKAVITVPAYFTDSQRQATREAGEIAGLDVTRIINEPTAASLAYESNSPKNQKILVYDLGGGTFDVSIVSIEEGVVEVLAGTGDNNLGGDDFDNKIADLLVDHIKNNLGISVKDDRKVMARLKQAAEAAKIRLSSAFGGSGSGLGIGSGLGPGFGSGFDAIRTTLPLVKLLASVLAAVSLMVRSLSTSRRAVVAPPPSFTVTV